MSQNQKRCIDYNDQVGKNSLQDVIASEEEVSYSEESEADTEDDDSDIEYKDNYDKEYALGVYSTLSLYEENENLEQAKKFIQESKFSKKINDRDHNGLTPLVWAARFGSKDWMLDCLINSSIDIDACEQCPGHILLIYAISRGSLTIVNHLLGKKIQLKTRIKRDRLRTDRNWSWAIGLEKQFINDSHLSEKLTSGTLALLVATWRYINPRYNDHEKDKDCQKIIITLLEKFEDDKIKINTEPTKCLLHKDPISVRKYWVLGRIYPDNSLLGQTRRFISSKIH